MIEGLDRRAFLRRLGERAIAAADPMKCVPPHLPVQPTGQTIVLGAGKASAAMARAVETHWQGPLKGLVVTRYGHGAPTEQIEIVEAAHPVPDSIGHETARRILAMAEGAGPEDLVLCLVSGGGSSLLALPAPGLTLADKQRVNKALLRSGASIDEMNTVRRHLSAIKGGRLAAAAHPARVVTLLISDVPGDDPAVIASGPTVPDSTTFSDARAILRKYGIEEPQAAIRHLETAMDETPKPGDPRLAMAETVMVARPQASLEAAAMVAHECGITPIILGDSIEGESRDVAKVMAAIARQVATHGQPARAPAVLLSGGETTVTVRGQGRGGRNVEFLLALAISLQGHPGICGLAIDTDGIDGAEENAGALVTPETLTRAAALGLDAMAMLADNDAHTFFERLDDTVVTGPTLTNVNDFRAILVLPEQG